MTKAIFNLWQNVCFRDAHDTFFISEPAETTLFEEDYLEKVWTYFLSLLWRTSPIWPKVRKIHSDGGWGSQGYGYNWKREEAAKNLLRTHTTAVSARMLYRWSINSCHFYSILLPCHRLAQQKEFQPQKYFSIDRVFRNETLDATHLAEFHQIEVNYQRPKKFCPKMLQFFFSTKQNIVKIRREW